MKLKFVLIALVAAFGTFAACKKDKKDDPKPGNGTGTLTIKLDHKVDATPLQVNSGVWYTNALGSEYQVNLFCYYMSKFVLVKSDNSADTIEYFQLVDPTKPAQCQFNLDKVKNGTYTKLRFYVGVGPERNHSGAQDGFLDPGYGMIWTWNTGYIFMKLEGQFKNSSSQVKPLRHHLGSDDGLSVVEIPLNNLEVNSNTRKLNFTFNVNELYTTPANIDFNTDFDRQSSSSADAIWIGAMKSNIGAGVFSLTSVE